MQIEKRVGHREQDIVDVGHDLLRRRSKRISGKRTVEVKVVEG